MNKILAPEWHISDWLNTKKPLSLASLRGQVVLIEAFQMLCPGCVSHGLPMASKAHQIFARHGLQVIGLHSVFEHHDVQGSKAALEAFAHEYKIQFPLAIDARDPDNHLPLTMRSYRLRGTPSQILIDREGYIRLHDFGQTDPMVLGAEIMALLNEKPIPVADQDTQTMEDNCGPDGCRVPA